MAPEQVCVEVSTLDLLDQAQAEQRRLVNRVKELENRWRCERCGCEFPRETGDEAVAHCTQCVTVEEQGKWLAKYQTAIQTLRGIAGLPDQPRGHLADLGGEMRRLKGVEEAFTSYRRSMSPNWSEWEVLNMKSAAGQANQTERERLAFLTAQRRLNLESTEQP